MEDDLKFGVIKSPSGHTYEGELRNNFNPHGKGKQIWPCGAIYEGDWVNGRMHGQGVYKYPNGIIYDGGWNKGKKHGKGVGTQPSGKKFNLVFEHNVKIS